MPAIAPAPSLRRWLAIYRELGLQPVPSDPTPAAEGGRKKPLVRYADFWERRFDSDPFLKFPCSNVQVMLGRHWGLCVLDLDGPEAVRVVERDWPKLPWSWASCHGDGRRSRHLWFKTPPDAGPRPKSVLWAAWDDDSGGWRKHTAVELLCDRSLIMAPPSVHPKTRRLYNFARGRSPSDCPLATAPRWLWEMPAVRPPSRVAAPEPDIPLTPLTVQPRAAKANRVDWRQVLNSLPVRQVAEGWGLRFAGGPEHDGWVSVHDFGREDRTPSARFNVVSGRYWRPGMGPKQTLSLFELGAAIGHYPDWSACLDALASYYGHAR